MGKKTRKQKSRYSGTRGVRGGKAFKTGGKKRKDGHVKKKKHLAGKKAPLGGEEKQLKKSHPQSSCVHGKEKPHEEKK